MNKKYAAFGASVTQQENGYADQLYKKYGLRIKKFGYGGMHLPDAGVCFIDNVVKYKPDCVLIDWFSTDFMEQSEKTLKCIDTILYKFSLINCAVIFLIFPEMRTDGRQDEKYHFYKFCKNELLKRNAYFIDLSTEFNDDVVSKILRDSIHTTESGGGTYAKAIFEHLQKKTPYVLDWKLFEKNAYYKDVYCLNVNRVFNKEICITANCEILGFYCTVGRHSGLCNIEFDDGTKEQKSLWDRWCHYERKHFCLPIPQYLGDITIRILQDDFDTSSCKIPVDFRRYKKSVTLHAIYYLGNCLEIKNAKNGSILSVWCIEIIRMLKLFKHISEKMVKKIMKNFILRGGVK